MVSKLQVTRASIERGKETGILPKFTTTSFLSYEEECPFGQTFICNTFGLKMQVIVSYLGCVCKRKAPDGKGSASVPDGFTTELANVVCLSPSDLAFKWGGGEVVMAAREKNRCIKG